MADITAKPAKVMYLSAPERSDDTFAVSWKNPSSNTDSNSRSRASKIHVTWWLYCTTEAKTRHYTWEIGGSSASDSLDLGDVLTSVGSNFFHPHGSAFLKKVTVNVWAVNDRGWSTQASTSTTITAPGAPTISEPEFDSSDGSLSWDLSVPDDEGSAPFERVSWWINRYDTETKRTVTRRGNATDDVTITEDVAGNLDITNWQALANDTGRAIKVALYAKSQGWRGDGSTVSRVTYVSRPKVPTIKKVTIPSSYANDKVIVQFAMNKTTAHPVTGCRLQVYQDTAQSPHTSKSDFNGTETWEDFELSDDGECSALAIGVSEVVPEVDRTSWIRVKVWNLDEDRLVSHSAPYRLKKLETASPTAADDRCFLAPLENSGNDSILLHCYWGTTANPDDSTGTEVTWADSSNAWDSTVQPSSFETELNHGAATYVDSGGLGKPYQGHIDFYIRDLEPGTKYWVRCRRYLDGDRKTVGPWSSKLSAIVGTPPASVDLSAPSQIANGKALPCEFNIEAEDEVVAKTTWRIYLDPKVYHLNGQGTTILGILGKSGTGGSAASVPWSKVQSALKASGRKYVDVLITAGFSGATVTSDIIRVYVIDPPKCKVVTHTVTEQPATFDVKLSDKVQNLRCVVTSLGMNGDDALDRTDQEPGDCVWSELIEEPLLDTNADADSSAYPLRTTVTMPEGCDLRDGARYRVTVSAESAIVPGEGLRSSDASGTLRVSYSHQAAVPGDATVTPRDVTSSAGVRRRYATISLAKPDYDLAPFFWRALDDSGLWVSPEHLVEAGSRPGSGWYRISTPLTANLDMSVKKSALLVSGSTYAIAPSTTYTVLMEVRKATVTGTVRLSCASGSASAWSATKTVDVTGSGLFKVEVATKSSITGSSVTKLDVSLAAAGGSFKGDVRLSLFEGSHDGGSGVPSTAEGRSTDRYDVYRVTPDGATPVAIGVATDAVVTDEYAPYGDGEQRYRVCTRTVDGDLAWGDSFYRFPAGVIRIDFDGTYVELPYNVASSDAFSKGFESRAHFGQKRPSGYWNASVARTGQLSTDLIRVEDEESVRRVRRLAQWSGPCFVRLPNGCAYEADVQVSGLEETCTNGAVSISLDVTEILPTGTYSEVGSD